MKRLNLLLAGYKGYRFLEELILRREPINLIYSYENEFFSNIEVLCNKNSIKLVESKHPIINYDTKEFYIAIGWQYLLESPPFNFVIFHDSALPKYRGWCPTVSALINGEHILGTTAVLPGDSMDSGPIICRKLYNIKYPAKIKHVYIKVIENYYKMYKIVKEQYEKKSSFKIESYQDHEEASYSLWRDNADYEINWNWNSQKIKRFVDAVGYPYSGAVSIGSDVRNDVFGLPIINEVDYGPKLNIVNPTPGKIFKFNKDGYPDVVCGDGHLISIKLMTYNLQVYYWEPKRVRHRLG